MIKTVSEFLDRLRQVENEALKGQDIKHGPTIGDMYEGLTQHLLSRSLPSESGIEVVGGFICDEQGHLSDELDCMVVTAPGVPIPYTEKRRFVVDDVAAVIQVKKNLYSNDLRSGYENLSSVNKCDPTRSRKGHLFQDAYQGTTRTPLPRMDEVGQLPYELQIVHRTLALELYYPARIIFGYNGFQSQSTLRTSFADYLESQVIPGEGRSGFGVFSLPTLICCGTHSLVKANGMPFIAPIDEEGYWPVYLSMSGNPLELLLEVVWTRLVYGGTLPGSIFDDGSLIQTSARFIDARPVHGGWEYRVLPTPGDASDMVSRSVEWEPFTLDVLQWTVAERLCEIERVDTQDPGFVELVAKHGYSVASFVASLRGMGLAGLEGTDLVLLTRECQCAILPDGRFVAGENCAGQFTEWFSRYMGWETAARPGI